MYIVPYQLFNCGYMPLLIIISTTNSKGSELMKVVNINPLLLWIGWDSSMRHRKHYFLLHLRDIISCSYVVVIGSHEAQSFDLKNEIAFCIIKQYPGYPTSHIGSTFQTCSYSIITTSIYIHCNCLLCFMFYRNLKMADTSC